MVLPIRNESDDATARLAFIRSELQALTEEQVNMDTARDYFDGYQELVYTTEAFEETFGDAFDQFRENWCKVIINAVNNRTKLLGFNFDDDEDFALAKDVWDIFRDNEIGVQQRDHHEGILVEDRAFVIVWPDDEKGATIDWQPGQLCRVRYNPDNRTKADWAVKRWTDEDGQVYVTVYTPESVFKYVERAPSQSTDRPSSMSALTEVPSVGTVANLAPRRVRGESWPLDNPFNPLIPVVEFNNSSYQSELSDAMPQQDALNATLVDMMLAGKFQAMSQRYMVSRPVEPEGGWNAGPGEMWQIPPMFDEDGKLVETKIGEFSVTSPESYIRTINHYLQAIANTSSTPVRLFLQDDRGGRGDAPSGESLLVEDKPLNDKVGDKHDRWGPRWVDVAKLVIMAAPDRIATPIPDFLRAEADWQDPRHDFRMSLISEASAMVTMGIPVQFAVEHLSLRPEELKRLLEMIEQEKADKEAKEEEQFNRQQQLALTSGSSDSSSDSSTDT